MPTYLHLGGSAPLFRVHLSCRYAFIYRSHCCHWCTLRTYCSPVYNCQTTPMPLPLCVSSVLGLHPN